MLRFAMADYATDKDVDVLDYGGGGGQFALVLLSHFPNAKIWITDKDDEALLSQYRCINQQIPFALFQSDPTKFDIIFLNDVFEHVDAPQEVLGVLAKKLKVHGRIFIDTPKTFWIYPFLRATFKSLYEKLCIGTVNNAHLQIWSKRSFEYVVSKAGLKLKRYREISEFTMPPEYYLSNMGINNSIVKVLGRMLHRFAHFLVRNKIMAVLSKPNQ